MDCRLVVEIGQILALRPTLAMTVLGLTKTLIENGCGDIKGSGYRAEAQEISKNGKLMEKVRGKRTTSKPQELLVTCIGWPAMFKPSIPASDLKLI